MSRKTVKIIEILVNFKQKNLLANDLSKRILMKLTLAVPSLDNQLSSQSFEKIDKYNHKDYFDNG